MLHVSTRGEAPAIGFCDALLTGLARDGGLYVPSFFPVLGEHEIAGFAGKSYAEVAFAVLSRLVDGEIAEADLKAMIAEAYGAFVTLRSALAQIDANLFVLELFHGPTLAFKDVAMRLLAKLMDHVLKARGQRATIVGATSGDTGSAAIDAFTGLGQVDIVILFPNGRVSEVQRRQMTTVGSGNVHAVAVEGTFDDCQALVKAMFNHHAFRDELKLSGVNSINWARIAAQTVYYFTAAVALGSPARPVTFAVPTGNFGDVLAGWVAKRMGLPVERLVVGTNVNDILVRTLHTGAYEVTGVTPTTSPSMDIQVSSNFERLLFDAYDRDAEAIRALMGSLQQGGAFTVGQEALAAIRAEFDAVAVSEDEVKAEMAALWQETNYGLDPHGAVGVRAGRKALDADPRTPVVVLGTAHPAKFPDAVEAATGARPPLPAHLADLYEREERMTVLPNDQAAVERFIRARARIVTDAAA